MYGDNITARGSAMKEMKSRSLAGLVLIVVLLAMFGCGGGGGGVIVAPQKAAVKVQTTGVPGGTLVGAVQVMLNYSSSKYTISPTPVSGINPDVVASGAGAGSLVTATTNTSGQLGIGLLNATGITGNAEFATATFTMVPGKTQAAGDFTVALVPAPEVFNNANPSTQIAGASVAVSSVTIH